MNIFYTYLSGLNLNHVEYSVPCLYLSHSKLYQLSISAGSQAREAIAGIVTLSFILDLMNIIAYQSNKTVTPQTTILRCTTVSSGPQAVKYIGDKMDPEAEVNILFKEVITLF